MTLINNLAKNLNHPFPRICNSGGMNICIYYAKHLRKNL